MGFLSISSFGGSTASPSPPPGSYNGLKSSALDVQSALDAMLEKVQADTPGYLQCLSIGTTSKSVVSKLNECGATARQVHRPLSPSDGQDCVAVIREITTRIDSLATRMAALRDHFEKMGVLGVVKKQIDAICEGARVLSIESVDIAPEEHRAAAEEAAEQLLRGPKEVKDVYGV